MSACFKEALKNPKSAIVTKIIALYFQNGLPWLYCLTSAENYSLSDIAKRPLALL